MVIGWIELCSLYIIGIRIRYWYIRILIMIKIYIIYMVGLMIDIIGLMILLKMDHINLMIKLNIIICHNSYCYWLRDYHYSPSQNKINNRLYKNYDIS